METKTHIGIYFKNGKMYGRNKLTYCWEEMDNVVSRDEYDTLLSNLSWKKAILKNGREIKTLEIFAIQDGEVLGFDDKLCDVSEIYNLE